MNEDIETFVKAYTERTAGSKRFAERHRAYHVDKSSIAFGSTPETQALTYPIVVDRASGSKLWDIDGNVYTDILQGLGANLFGHNPDFVREALVARMQDGFPIGVQTEMVGEVAKLLVKLTGMPRVCFSNTGTEAIMTAIRIARAKTGRSKVAVFTDSYHGHVDTVLMRATLLEYARKKLVRRFDGRILGRVAGKFLATQAVPASVGIPKSVSKDVLVLEYGNPKSLDVIRSNRRKLAAVLVEPVQSRHPERQPKAFLHDLREVTQDGDIALIFDEMVTGFRVHAGGAQAHFEVEADLATYSKIVGGGLPLSVVAGRDAYMDCLQPCGLGSRDKTAFFAGTFCKHPLSLAASHAVLSHLIETGPGLHDDLNVRTEAMVGRLNERAQAASIPVRFTHFGSFFAIAMSQSEITPEAINRLSYHLLHKGIHLRGGDRGGFLTTAHSEADIDKIVDAFTSGLQQWSQLR